MKRKISAFFTATLIAVSCVGCGGKNSSSASRKKTTPESTSGATEEDTDLTKPTELSNETTEVADVPTTLHVSPTERVVVSMGTQVDVKKTIPFTPEQNTIKIPLADLIDEGDTVSSFTFVIRSADGSNIGTFKGGCGISVGADCPSATHEGWYQSPDFSAGTQGSYGEIKWDVPLDVATYVSGGGDVLFGYWWGDASAIEVDSIICNFTRARDVPTDGSVTVNVGASVGYADGSNIISIPIKDSIPKDAIPECVTFNVISSGGFRKLNCGYGFGKGAEIDKDKPDFAIFTNEQKAQVTWFPSNDAKSKFSSDDDIKFGYWWSEQPTLTVESVNVRYSVGNTYVSGGGSDSPDPSLPISNSDFRTAAQIVDAMNVGWNLGNTLDSYNCSASGLATETGWGNPKTTQEMIASVKSAGFNSIRIPVTWGEHMTGDNVDAEWMARVKQVVDYAYNSDMFVILDMHHDDYIWFAPDANKYAENSAKLKAIWTRVSGEFADYGDRLIFEGMNEPRTVGSSNEWLGGTSEERAVVNKYEQDFVDAVRATGGNNAYRTLIVTSYAASAENTALNDVVIPKKAGNVIFSVHYYAPWKFADGTETVFDDAGRKELSDKFAQLKSKFADNGVPVIIDEFGCVNACDALTRNAYYSYYVGSAASYGLKCFIWDNGVSTGSGSYGIFDRKALKWNESLLSSVMNAVQ